ncbi:MAG: sigma-54-dependent Fis family transcriptional regulator, partial [Acidobacteria bacterium]|nr:sigma-54-dependent Fis family transcriptional regulator [Acidobacteriota bacterium]
LRFRVQGATDCASALALMATTAADVAVVDYNLPDGDALSLLRKLDEAGLEIPVVVLTGHGSIELAVQALQAGAVHFLTKPVEGAALKLVLDRALEGRRRQRLERAQRSADRRRVLDPFTGSSRAIADLRERATRIASVDSPVLVLGATGSGKGTLARWLHEHGPRQGEAFVDLNCAALSRELLESELFGYARGAFSGAVSNKPGLIEAAHGGTLFLDEIGDLDPQIQPKLLKVIEEKRFRRLGEVNERTVDVRLIVATHRDLRRRIEERAFRDDLFFRVSTFQLVMPPLRDRPEDIPDLASFLMARVAGDMGRPQLHLTPAALEALQGHSWPGNVRELRNVLERAALFAEDHRIQPADLRFDPVRTPPSQDGSATTNGNAAARRLKLEDALRAENWHVGRAAKRLGLPRSTMYLRIKQMGILLPGR